MTKKNDISLSLETEVELIAIKGKKPYKKNMSYKKALNIPRKKGWRYIIYQVGFSQFKTE